MVKRTPRKIGTDAEVGVVAYLRDNGFPNAERRALRGVHDAGDITGTPGVAWEIKGGDQARTAGDLLIIAWLEQTEIERVSAGAEIGVLVVQRAGFGNPRAGKWWAIVPALTLARLYDDLRPSTLIPTDERLVQYPITPARLLLGDLVGILRSAGYGDAPLLDLDRAGAR